MIGKIASIVNKVRKVSISPDFSIILLIGAPSRDAFTYEAKPIRLECAFQLHGRAYENGEGEYAFYS